MVIRLKRGRGDYTSGRGNHDAAVTSTPPPLLYSPLPHSLPFHYSLSLSLSLRHILCDVIVTAIEQSNMYCEEESIIDYLHKNNGDMLMVHMSVVMSSTPNELVRFLFESV